MTRNRRRIVVIVRMSSFSRVELEFCKDFADKLMHHPLAGPFLQPVNPQVDNAANYLQVIQYPMDLETIKNNLEDNHYTNSWLWARDINLMWDNTKQYNLRKTIIYESTPSARRCSRRS
jgi:hypothetical protein